VPLSRHARDRQLENRRAHGRVAKQLAVTIFEASYQVGSLLIRNLKLFADAPIRRKSFVIMEFVIMEKVTNGRRRRAGDGAPRGALTGRPPLERIAAG
jgi:hypothetical protein